MLVESDEEVDDDITQFAEFSVENSPEHEFMIEYNIEDDDSQDDRDDEELNATHDEDLTDLDLDKCNVGGPSQSSSDVNIGIAGVDKETTMKYLSGDYSCEILFKSCCKGISSVCNVPET